MMSDITEEWEDFDISSLDKKKDYIPLLDSSLQISSKEEISSLLDSSPEISSFIQKLHKYQKMPENSRLLNDLMFLYEQLDEKKSKDIFEKFHLPYNIKNDSKFFLKKELYNFLIYFKMPVIFEKEKKITASSCYHEVSQMYRIYDGYGPCIKDSLQDIKTKNKKTRK